MTQKQAFMIWHLIMNPESERSVVGVIGPDGAKILAAGALAYFAGYSDTTGMSVAAIEELREYLRKH